AGRRTASALLAPPPDQPVLEPRPHQLVQGARGELLLQVDRAVARELVHEFRKLGGDQHAQVLVLGLRGDFAGGHNSHVQTFCKGLAFGSRAFNAAASLSSLTARSSRRTSECADSLSLRRRRWIKARGEGGNTKMLTLAGGGYCALIWAAPCTSMSSSTCRPRSASRRTSLFRVPYHSPAYWAHSSSSCCCLSRSNFSRETKWYARPFRSPRLGARVVAEMEKPTSLRARTRRWAMLVFPAPDGAHKMTRK